MTETLFQSLLRKLFEGSGDELRSCLQPLTAAQRKALFSEFGPLPKILQRTCRYQPDARPVRLIRLYQAIREDPAGFLQDQAATLALPGALNNPQTLQHSSYETLRGFYSRLQLLQVGLADKTGVVGAFGHHSTEPVRTERFLLQAGRILLDRPESWVQETFIRVCEEFLHWTRFTDGDLGAAQLLQEALQRHPDWIRVLAPSMGRAMRRDGFFNRPLDRYDAAMILAGLDDEPPAQKAGLEPLMDPEIVQSILRRAANGDLPRSDLIALILRKLHSPLRPSIIKCWIHLFGQLALTDAEFHHHAKTLLDLIHAPTPAAGKLALQMIETHFLQDPDRAGERIATLGSALQNPLQIIAKGAWNLLKKQLKALPDGYGPMTPVVIAGLSSPHAALRSELLRWLGALPLQQFDEDALRRVRELAAVLPPAELSPIAHLLAERPAAANPAPMMDSVVDQCAMLQEQIAAIRQRAEEQPGNVLLNRRLAFLGDGLTPPPCGVLKATLPDHSAALTPPDGVWCETAEALALDMVRTRRRALTWADYDRLFAGMLRFADAAQSSRVQTILAPLAERLTFWQKPLADGAYPGWAQAVELPALLLAQVWRERRIAPFATGSRGAQMLNLHFSLALQRRLRHMLKLLAAGQDILLSQPTHAAGWLAPAAFAERFARLPHTLLDPEELGAALYRLPALPELRAAAWTMLAPQLESCGEDDLYGEALRLALAPDDQAEIALVWFLRYFERKPPTEPLFYATTDFSGGGLAGVLRIKMFKIDHDTSANVAFRLFNAALRCRYGLGDAGIASRSPRLMAKLAANRGWRVKTLQNSMRNIAAESGSSSAMIAELLFAPAPVTETLVESLHAAWSSYLGRDTAYPFLWPYLMAHPQHFGTPEQVADLAYRFPPLAQHLFEAGLYRRNLKGDYYRDFTQALLAQGLSPTVDVRPLLNRAAQGLLAAQPAQRESGVDGFTQWLDDGRVTPQEAAAMLAGLIRDTELGFSALDQALAALGATGEAGKITVLLALEQAIGGDLAGFSPRKQSLILDRLAGLLDETGRSVADPAARQALERLAATPKKSVAHNKANALITRPASAMQPPLDMLAVAALALR